MTSSVQADVFEEAAAQFGRIMVQHEGRLKPMDTFARAHLLTYHQKSTIDGKSATMWLAETLLDPAFADEQPLFKIRNEDVLIAFDIEPSDDGLYSYNTLIKGIDANFQMLVDINKLEQDQRTRLQTQLLQTYMTAISYFEVSRSMSGIVPSILVHDEQLASELNLEPYEMASYYHFIKYADYIAPLINELNETAQSDRTDKQEALLTLVGDLNQASLFAEATRISVLEPLTGEVWHSPWELLKLPQLQPDQKQKLDLLEQYFAALASGDTLAATHTIDDFIDLSNAKSTGLELFYNRADLFTKSLACYIAGFFLLLLSLVVFKKWTHWFSIIVVSAGGFVHLSGLGLRMIIMGRAPVSNLYETIIFVGVVAAVFGVIMELMRRDRVGLLIATSLGAAFHLIGFRYALEGDTMGMLVAVLDSNFWLSTHVITITIGYGATLVTSLLGHIILLRLMFIPHSNMKTTSLLSVARGSAVVALFFTTLGTILGGIWADQSWGRFWGWDPKENGALLIVLWLLFVMHGRLSGRLKAPGYAACLALSSVSVILAWFGVNLLGVGLHNYGFTDSILVSIIVFCSAEAAIISFGYVVSRIRQM